MVETGSIAQQNADTEGMQRTEQILKHHDKINRVRMASVFHCILRMLKAIFRTGLRTLTSSFIAIISHVSCFWELV